jgi:2',3'-cyclic-nucleotide 2'-phosphodiesterase (5'-nucleotidase family)
MPNSRGHIARIARALATRAVVALSLGLSVTAVAACDACQPKDTKVVAPADEKPTVRLYLVSDLAGALEPCGCVKDQLGGMDHFGALVRAEEARAPAYATVTAGPTFFMDPDLDAQKKSQDVAKAETIADALASVRLAAFAPARNEWANGPQTLETITKKSGAAFLFANASGATTARATVKEIGGVKVGFVGVSSPSKAREGKPLEAVKDGPLAEAVTAGLAELEKQGADVTVLLASVGRGEAKRLADQFPKLLAILVGSPGGAGEANTQAPPAEQVGNVLIVETGNHLQTVGVLDLHVREKSFTFADGTGLEVLRKREALAVRIDELRKKIATWEADPTVAKVDVDARRQELQKLEREREGLEKTAPPAKGSFYRFAMREIRTSLGNDAQMSGKLSGYYKRVNEENKLAFASRMPPAAGKDDATYVGVDACTKCHEDARKVWDGTAHAHAYKTLSDQFKEFNLDCVSCHVTGYEKPGGSTVTHVELLKNVQCEVCHGPGSKHERSPKVAMPVPRPQADTCTACHHPPHVHEFDGASKMNLILGKGHGRK